MVPKGKKIHACKYCEKRFTQLKSFKLHELIHTGKPTGEKTYSCKTCSYRCRDLADLKNHEILHTGKKPFACQFCNLRFSTQQGLKTHEKSKTHGFMVRKTPKEEPFN